MKVECVYNNLIKCLFVPPRPSPVCMIATILDDIYTHSSFSKLMVHKTVDIVIAHTKKLYLLHFFMIDMFLMCPALR